MNNSKLFCKMKFISKDSISLVDWIIFILMGLICICICVHPDIMHTVGSSFSYLNGHFLDFYDYNKLVPTIGGDAYLPSTYLLFAIWNIPIRLLGLVQEATMGLPLFVVVWNKLFTTLFYLASGILVFKICKYLKLGNYYSKICAFVFLTAPIGFFSQFIFGQYDIFTVFFVLLGFYYYLKNDDLKFIVFFGIAITFKYFALLVFIPLLLLKEKNILKVILKCGLVAVPFILEVLLYINSEGFRQDVFGFGAKNYIFDLGFSSPFFNLSIFILGWVLICGWTYFKDINTVKEYFEWSLFYINCVLFLLFGLSMWHPQWLLFATPFWAMGTMINKKRDAFLVLDIIMMGLFVIFTVNIWRGDLDQGILSMGVLGKYVPGRLSSGLMMKDIFIIQDRSLIYSFLSALMAVNAVFKYPKFVESDWTNIKISINLVRARFVVGIAIFLIPLGICFVSALNSPTAQFYSQDLAMEDTGPLTEERTISQIFTASEDNVSRVDVKLGTYGKQVHSELKIAISDYSTGEELFAQTVETDHFKDNEYAKIKIPTLSIDKEKKYVVSFKSQETKGTELVSIYHELKNGQFDREREFSIIDGEKKNYNLCIKIYSDAKND